MLSMGRLFHLALCLTTHIVSTRTFAVKSNSIKDIELPTNAVADSLEGFEVPQHIPVTHNITVCNLQLRGYLAQQLDFIVFLLGVWHIII